MMRFLSFCCLLLLSVAQDLRAQESSLLWKISGKELAQPSYLFGTIHQICEEDYFWTDTMQKYFHRAQQLCLELDMDDPLLAVKVSQHSINTGNKSLKDYFTPKEYSRLSVYIKEHTGQSMEMYNRLKPIWLVLTLSNGDLGCDAATAYEIHLVDSAKKYEMPVMGLETVDEQMAALSSIPEDKIKPYILDIIDGRTEQNTELFQRMVATYLKQDVEALYRIIESENDAMLSMDKLLDNRNKRWIARIADIGKNKSTFFAVGAGHLGGPGGVLALLRQAGYTVTPLR
ncbi:TraB/GumN family protein [Edaphocola flava]|uniref:TraB/GumN family protein n=1 Tax=Edaphocola flava TaxID=2499629 RepID=UPI00100B5413|nr:TraB/GumN family protein [Edaphocola flava]